MSTSRQASGGAATVPKYPYIYIPDGALDGWRAAKAALPATPAWITAITDEAGLGFQAGQPNNGWFDLMRTAFLAQYSLLGDFYSAYYDAGAHRNSTPLPWAKAVAPSTANNGYGYLESWLTQNGVMPLTTFTTPYACTEMDIITYDGNTSGTHFDYALDGGAAVTVTGALTAKMRKTTLTGLINTTHAVQFGNQNADQSLYLQGMSTFLSRTAGMGFANVGTVGAMSGMYGTQSWPGGDKPTLWQGLDATGATHFGFPTQPHLAIIALGPNDCAGSDPNYAFGPGGFQHQISRFIRAFRRGRPTGSIVLLGYSNPDPTNSDITTGNYANAAQWFRYLAVMRSLAQAYNCVFVNIAAKWGLTPGALGFITNGNAKPNLSGHQDIWNVLATIL
jgi:hypothetical protein